MSVKIMNIRLESNQDLSPLRPPNNRNLAYYTIVRKEMVLVSSSTRTGASSPRHCIFMLALGKSTHYLRTNWSLAFQ